MILDKLLEAMVAYDRYWFIKTRNNFYPIELRIKEDKYRFYVNNEPYSPEFDCPNTAENWLYLTGCTAKNI